MKVGSSVDSGQEKEEPDALSMTTPSQAVEMNTQSEEVKAKALSLTEQHDDDERVVTATVTILKQDMKVLRHPFDPRESAKNPFPTFDVVMGLTEKSENEADSSNTSADALNWSIDTIAELKPMAFSPLSAQKAAVDVTASDFTPNNKYEQFFEDEAQFRVLRTPSPVIRQQQLHGPQPPFEPTMRQSPVAAATNSSSATANTQVFQQRASPIPSFSPTPRQLLAISSTPQELHHRCRETIAYCEERLRERQAKMNRLRVPYRTPPPAKKNKRNLTSTTSSNLISNSSMREDLPTTVESSLSSPGFPDVWGASPIASQTPITLATPSNNPITPSSQTRQRPKANPFDCSPIPFQSLKKDTIIEEDEEEKEEDKAELSAIEVQHSSAEPPSFASLTFSPSEGEDDDDQENKENRMRLQATTTTTTMTPLKATDSLSSSSLSRAFTLSSWGKTAEDSLSLKTMSLLQETSGASTSGAEETSQLHSVAQRQKSFVAAIEAEAHTNKRQLGGLVSDDIKTIADTSDQTSKSAQPVERLTPLSRNSASVCSDKQNTRSSGGIVSITSIYKEAKVLGIVEPRAQWEYVQIIKQQQQRQPSGSSSGAFGNTTRSRTGVIHRQQWKKA